MIPILYYNEIDIEQVERSFDKVLKQLTAGDFKSADVRKMSGNGYYRARLDIKNRLLFTFVSFQGKKYLLLLEVIKNHNYTASRFLRGADLPDEHKLQPISCLDETSQEEDMPLAYVNNSTGSIHILNKYISFDETQQSIFHLHPPLIIIGSAGSGKTVLVLEKLKQLKGNVAYISLSQYLVENARKIYYGGNYNNENQEIDFLSFNDYIASWQIPAGKEIHYRAFEQWFNRHAQHTKLSEPHRVYEEFKGVITGSPLHTAFLSREEYLSLGIKQSIFPADKREQVYALFIKHIAWLKENNYYDTNLLSFKYLDLIKPRYDYVMIDEVQDITSIQLKCIMQSLVSKGNFILTGDSNQIVHPNFFSWSKIKTYLYKDYAESNQVRILQANYRNSPEVVQLSNALLKIKNARFGSIDKESNYLINTISGQKGEVILLPDNDKIKSELNKKTQRSTHYAVIVSNNELKEAARRFFKTPLVFSVHEAKGLEYENVILLNFISSNPKEFNEIIRGVEAKDLEQTELVYARAADKRDKDAEIYKFYINSLYVALTRAIKNIYLFENQLNHPVLELLSLKENKQPLQVTEQQSDKQEWLAEAQRLEEQGKHEQAEQIRGKMYGYEYISPQQLELIKTLALDPVKKEAEVKKERKQLFQYAINNFKIDWIDQLAALGFQRAMLYMKEVRQERKEYAKNCRLGRKNEVDKVTKKYGPDFSATDNNVTGLMLALHHGQNELVRHFISHRADINKRTHEGWLAIDYLLQGFYKNEIYRHTFVADRNILLKYWHAMRPASLIVQTFSQRLSLSSHSMAFFLLLSMRCIEQELPSTVEIKYDDPEKADRKAGVFNMDTIMNFISCMPDSLLPAYRKQRSYVNSILAMHEVDRDTSYNKRLFVRVRRGCYIINPNLSFNV